MFKKSAISTATLSFLLVSIYMGSGLMYGHFRLYYVAFIFALPFLVPRFLELMRAEFRSENRLRTFLLIVPILLMGWYLLSILWAEEKRPALIYNFYIGGGLAIVAAIMAIARTETELKRVFKILFIPVAANLVAGIFETTGHFRWVVSRYSTFNNFFGLDPKYGIYIKSLEERRPSCPVEYDYLISNPAGFNWGPNQLAFALVLSLPLCLCLIKNRTLKILVGSAHLYLLIMAGSRAALVGALIACGITFALSFRLSKFTSAISLALCVITLSLPFAPLEKLGVNPYRANKIASIATGVTNFKRYCTGIQQEREDGSVTERHYLIERAWQQFKDHPLRGVGAGNSWQSIGLLFGKTHIHNFWLEILFEVGIFMFALLIMWAISIFGLLINALRNSKDPFTNSCATAILAAWLGCIPAAIAVGTVAHQPALWLLLGVSLAFILIQNRQERTR